MRADRSRRDLHLPGDRLDIEVQENAQHDHLALPGRQTPQRPENGAVQACPCAVEGRLVIVLQRHLAGAAPPPRRPGIERGAHNPRPRSRMSPDLPPRGPGPRERLGNLLLGLSHVASTGSYRAHAGSQLSWKNSANPFYRDSQPFNPPPPQNAYINSRKTRISQAGPAATYRNPAAPNQRRQRDAPPLLGYRPRRRPHDQPPLPFGRTQQHRSRRRTSRSALL